MLRGPNQSLIAAGLSRFFYPKGIGPSPVSTNGNPGEDFSRTGGRKENRGNREKKLQAVRDYFTKVPSASVSRSFRRENERLDQL